jgi:hypothetical protein
MLTQNIGLYSLSTCYSYLFHQLSNHLFICLLIFAIAVVVVVVVGGGVLYI